MLTYLDGGAHQGPTGVKVQGVQACAASGLRVEEGGGTAEGMEKELHSI